ncbi:MAG: DUF6268 family outer membrane beta-barrel protein [Verrucomicrobiota bacterium]
MKRNVFWQKSVLVLGAVALTLPKLVGAEATSDGYRGEFTAGAGLTAGSQLRVGDTKLGGLRSFNYDAGYTATTPLNEFLSLRLGLGWHRYDFDRPAAAPVPSQLQSVALRVGLSWQIAEKWKISGDLAPGIYSDFKDINWSDFNMPFGLRANFNQSPEVHWMFGFMVNVRSEYPVLPAVGVRWKLDDSWTLNLMVPKPGIEYKVNDALTLLAGGDFKGGAFRVAQDFGDRNGHRELNNQMLSYREIRAGVGLRYQMCKDWSVVADGGWMFDRRFRFKERYFSLRAPNAPYVQLGIQASY